MFGRDLPFSCLKGFMFLSKQCPRKFAILEAAPHSFMTLPIPILFNASNARLRFWFLTSHVSFFFFSSLYNRKRNWLVISLE